MSLLGEALLVLWSDVLPEAEAEWKAWHVREHMPDRMTVPGIELGRRYLNKAADRHQTFMMYEARSLQVFKSAAYLAQMNNPSALTRKLLPSIRNILRGVCRVVASDGAGVGEAIAAVRIVLAEPELGIDSRPATGLIEVALDQMGVIGAHLAVVDRAVTGIPTTEQKLRHDALDALDAILILEGSNRADITGAAADILKTPAFGSLGASSTAAGVYDLVYLLSATTAG